MGRFIALFIVIFFAAHVAFAQSGKKKEQKKQNLLEGAVIASDPVDRENLLLNIGTVWNQSGDNILISLLLDVRYRVQEDMVLNLNLILPSLIDVGRYGMDTLPYAKFYKALEFELGGKYSIVDKRNTKEGKLILRSERSYDVITYYYASYDRLARNLLNARFGYRYNQQGTLGTRLDLPEGRAELFAYSMHSLYVGIEYSRILHFLASVDPYGIRNRSAIMGFYADLILAFGGGALLVADDGSEFMTSANLGAKGMGFRIGHERYARFTKNLFLSKFRRFEVGLMPTANIADYGSVYLSDMFYAKFCFGLGHDLDVP